ncbi:MAG: ATP--guanido phosphotransferase, partial [Phycisphaerae bacterium]|nr:ATP--guanido phosphotransferase [Phycisphaerae bacterium]
MSGSLYEVARRAGEWLRGEGPMSEIVISTRIRLARNIVGYNFLAHADADMRHEVAETASGAVHKATGLQDYMHVDVTGLDEL